MDFAVLSGNEVFCLLFGFVIWHGESGKGQKRGGGDGESEAGVVEWIEWSSGCCRDDIAYLPCFRYHVVLCHFYEIYRGDLPGRRNNNLVFSSQPIGDLYFMSKERS